MKVIVCGGRDFTNAAFVWSWLDRLHEKETITGLMQGGAEGVDALASAWAKTKPGIKRYVCKADWEKHGRAAGPIRNNRMLEWKPDAVVAFPGGKGTANMVAQAMREEVRIVDLREIEHG